MITKADAVAAIEAEIRLQRRHQARDEEAGKTELAGISMFAAERLEATLAAINALPDSVTDDMVDRAFSAWQGQKYWVGSPVNSKSAMRAALEAALLGKE